MKRNKCETFTKTSYTMYFAIADCGIHTLIAGVNGVEKTATVFKANSRRIVSWKKRPGWVS